MKTIIDNINKFGDKKKYSYLYNIKISPMQKEIEYEKLRLDVLKKFKDERDIDCKDTKEEIIKALRLDDDGKYIRPTTYEKISTDKYVVGIDLKNEQHLREMGRLVEKKEAYCMHMYASHRIHYVTNRKLV